MNPVKIIIVDDHAMVRSGLTQLIKEYPNLEVIGEASDGVEFLALLNSHTPDVVFMDLNMPKMNGTEATKEGLKRRPDLKIIALTMNDDKEFVEEIMQLGAKGFVTKRAGISELITAIDLVMKGGSYFSHDIMQLFAKNMKSPTNEDKIELSKREVEVLKLISKGMSSQEIGETLCLSPRTIESHRASLLEKTQSKNTISLVLFAIKAKYVTVEK